ncbi:hypothetical protein Q7P36_004768 [Cladosporium allicinum]
MKPRPSSSRYTESGTQRANNLAFDTDRTAKSKAASKAKEFDSSSITSPLLDPRILERRVMAAKAGDRSAR